VVHNSQDLAATPLPCALCRRKHCRRTGFHGRRSRHRNSSRKKFVMARPGNGGPRKSTTNRPHCRFSDMPARAPDGGLRRYSFDRAERLALRHVDGGSRLQEQAVAGLARRENLRGGFLMGKDALATMQGTICPTWNGEWMTCDPFCQTHSPVDPLIWAFYM
jgi:hypothetical protein